MSEIESAERHHMDLEELVVDGYARMYIDREPALRLIEARDNAVRVALLNELATLVGEMQCDEGHEYEVAHQRSIEMATAKYTQPKEPTP